MNYAGNKTKDVTHLFLNYFTSSLQAEENIPFKKDFRLATKIMHVSDMVEIAVNELAAFGEII